jgi:hypothetical protein
MSMIAWYPLNGTLDDSLGTTIPSGSGISFTRSGKISTNAPDFNGASSFIDTGLQQSSLGRNFSISAWLYAEDSSNYRDAIGRHNNGGNGGFVFGEFNSGNLTFCIFSSKDSTLDNSVVGYSTTLPLNEWHHFVMVVKDLKTMAIYEDGILLKSATGSTDMNPIGTILIGKSYGSADRFWDGMIQDIRIYDECLTDHEIKELSKALILGLDFSDSYATDTEYDISGFKRNLENHGCTETYDSDEKKYVANFDGSSNYMVMKDQTYKSATKAITIIARVYCAAVNGYKTVMSSADGEGGIQFLPSNINEYIVNFLLSTGSSYSGYGNRPGYYGKWSTVAMTFDGKTVKTYIDGKINSTNTLSSSAEIVYSPTSYMFFGCDSRTTEPSSSYNKMKLEYFKIYSTALSSDDIKKEYETMEVIDKNGSIEAKSIIEDSDSSELIEYLELSTSFSGSSFIYDESAGSWCAVGRTWIINSGGAYIPIDTDSYDYAYYFDITNSKGSSATGNLAYVGFERFDSAKTPTSNDSCYYLYSSSEESSHTILTGSFNAVLSSAIGTDTSSKFVRLRILNDWSDSSQDTENHKLYIHAAALLRFPKGKSVDCRFAKNGVITSSQFIEVPNSEAKINKYGILIGSGISEL